MIEKFKDEKPEIKFDDRCEIRLDSERVGICKKYYMKKATDEEKDLIGEDFYETCDGTLYRLSYIDLVKLYNFINKNSLLINERFDA